MSFGMHTSSGLWWPLQWWSQKSWHVYQVSYAWHFSMFPFNAVFFVRLTIFRQFIALHKRAHIFHNEAISSHILLHQSPNGHSIRIISSSSGFGFDHQCEWSAWLILGEHRPKERVSCGVLFFFEKDLEIWHNRTYFPYLLFCIGLLGNSRANSFFQLQRFHTLRVWRRSEPGMAEGGNRCVNDNIIWGITASEFTLFIVGGISSDNFDSGYTANCAKC